MPGTRRRRRAPLRFAPATILPGPCRRRSVRLGSRTRRRNSVEARGVRTRSRLTAACEDRLLRRPRCEAFSSHSGSPLERSEVLTRPSRKSNRISLSLDSVYEDGHDCRRFDRPRYHHQDGDLPRFSVLNQAAVFFFAHAAAEVRHPGNDLHEGQPGHPPPRHVIAENSRRSRSAPRSDAAARDIAPEPRPLRL
jgi:hypothetical protein